MSRLDMRRTIWLTMLAALLLGVACSKLLERIIAPDQITRVPGTEFLTAGFSISPSGEWLVYTKEVPTVADSSAVATASGLVSIHLPTGRETHHLPPTSLDDPWEATTDLFDARGWHENLFYVRYYKKQNHTSTIVLNPNEKQFGTTSSAPLERDCSGQLPMGKVTGAIEQFTVRRFHKCSLPWRGPDSGAVLFVTDGHEIWKFNRARDSKRVFKVPWRITILGGGPSVSRIAVSGTGRLLAYVVFDGSTSYLTVLDTKWGWRWKVSVHDRIGDIIWAPDEDVLYYSGYRGAWRDKARKFVWAPDEDILYDSGYSRPKPNQGVYRVSFVK